MGYYFFDSSALAKYYVSETGTQWVQDIVDAQPRNDIAIAHFTGAEIVAEPFPVVYGWDSPQLRMEPKPLALSIRIFNPSTS